MARVVVPLPDRDFDTTESAVPWKLLTEKGHDVVFATERLLPDGLRRVPLREEARQAAVIRCCRRPRGTR